MPKIDPQRSQEEFRLTASAKLAKMNKSYQTKKSTREKRLKTSYLVDKLKATIKQLLSGRHNGYEMRMKRASMPQKTQKDIKGQGMTPNQE